MNLKIRKLKDMDIGTFLEVTYNDGKIFSGVLQDKDEECIAIVNEDGGEIVIEYGDIEVFVIKSRKDVDFLSPQPSQQDVKKTTDSSVEKEKEVKEKPSFFRNVEKLTITDVMLKNAFGNLDVKIKKSANGKYNSFMQALKVSDDKKAKRTFMTFTDEINKDKKLKNDEKLWNFVALLALRCGLATEDILLKGRCFCEAGVNAYLSEAFLDAGVFSFLALIKDEPKEDRNGPALSILYEACVKCDDTSVVERLLKEKEILPLSMELLQALFATKSEATRDSDSTKERVAKLNNLYVKKEMVEKAKKIIDKYGLDDIFNAEERAGEPAKTESLLGQIVKLSWSKDEGTIIYGESERKECFFSYGDIIDASFQKKVRETYEKDVESKGWYVHFNLEGEQASSIRREKNRTEISDNKKNANTGSTNIQSVQPKEALSSNEALAKGRAIILSRSDPERFADAIDLFEIALGDKTNRDVAVAAYIDACLALKNATDSEELGSEYISKALGIYSKYDKNIVRNLRYDTAVFSLLIKYGNNEDKIGVTRRLLEYDSIKPQQRLIYIASLADTYLAEAEKSRDSEKYERAKKYYQEWESSYHSNVQLFTTATLNRFYHTKILDKLAVCLLGLGEEEQAEQVLLKILKYDPNIESANRLYGQLTGIIESEQAEEDFEKDHIQEIDVADVYIREEEIDSEESDVSSLDDIQPYADVANWDDLGVSEEEAMNYIFKLQGNEKSVYTIALLKVLSNSNDSFLPLYNAVSLAVDNPLENPSYTITDIFKTFEIDSEHGQRTIDYCYACAGLRSAFYDTGEKDFSLTTLPNLIPLTNRYVQLKDLIVSFLEFKNKYDRGVDSFASYRFSDLSTQESKLALIVSKVAEMYNQYFSNFIVRENKKQLRFKLAKAYIYKKEGILELALRHIKDNDLAKLESVKEDFRENFIRNGLIIRKNNIDFTKIEKFIDYQWSQAGKDSRVVERRTSDLMGSLRSNLRSHVSDIVNLVCDWIELYEDGLVARIESDEKKAYEILQERLMPQLEDFLAELRLEAEKTTDHGDKTGIIFLFNTVNEIKRKMSGEWKRIERKYYFADFLRSNYIMLDKDFLPDFSSTFFSLPSFNIYNRLRSHIEEKGTIKESFERVFSRDRHYNNFGTAELLSEYSRDMLGVQTDLPNNFETYIMQTRDLTKLRYEQFEEDVELAYSKAQIMLNDEFMSTLDDTLEYWYSYCFSTKNFGFFFALLDACMEKINSDASLYKEKLLKEFEIMQIESPELFKSPDTKEEVEEQIKGLNFIVAEDWMNRLRREDFYTPAYSEISAIDTLVAFFEEYDSNFSASGDASVPLSQHVGRQANLPAKDKKGGMVLINNWLSNGRRSNCNKIAFVLRMLGWDNIEVSDISHNRIECYKAKTNKKRNTRIFKHPISAFGSATKDTGFIVACIYGFFDADRLLAVFQDLEIFASNKIVLLDYALSISERRRLARKIKETTLSNTYIIIDRVSLLFIANHFVSGMNDGMLMSVSMPFSYFQPYNDVSAIDMAPEMFIGREDELLSIESPTGANLIFGGRQLGKSSLLKKARNDIDGDELDRRAVFIDLKNINYKEAAIKISQELVDLKILSIDNVTGDWDELERFIINRLRNEENPIPYLLLMLDEADCLIETSKEVDFLPMVKLKNVQQSSSGKFKFVIAGLHDLVRFNRNVALGKNSVITHLSSINIKPFNYEDAEKLLLLPLSYLGFTFNGDSALISQILAATNYFPGLIQLYCKKLIEALRHNYANYNESDTPPYLVTDAHIRKVLADKSFREEIKKKFEITLTLDESYYILALLIAILDVNATNQDYYSAKDLLLAAEDLGVGHFASFGEEQIEALLMELTDLNILRNDGNDGFSFSMKNFRDMLGASDEALEKLSSLIQ